VAGRVLVAADGLGHPSLRNLGEFRRIRESAWRVGLGTVIPRFRTGDGHHTIQMAIAPEGYVGMVEAERGLCVVAAAVEPRHLRACGDASTAIECILHETKSPIPEFSGAWQGTPALTERLVRPVGWRVVVVGDAAGYVEPFTGEGIAWALTDAATVPRLVHRGLHDWTDRVERDWIRARNRVLGSQRLCRWTRAVVRTGATLDWVLRLTTRYPGLVVRGADRINAMPPGIRCGLQ
jgi:flavin-dependent dehydrogenase